MKKNLLLLLVLFASLISKSQDIDKATALQLVMKQASTIGLSNEEAQNVIVSNAYHDVSTGLDMIYLQQSFKGIPVYNEIQVLAFKDGRAVSNSGGRMIAIDKIAGTVDAEPAVAASQAVSTAMMQKNIICRQNITVQANLQGKKFNFGKLGVATEDISAELIWVPLQDGKKVRLAWQVYLVPILSSDYWMIRVDAKSNKVIDENNLTVYCNWNPTKTQITNDEYVLNPSNTRAAKETTTKLFDLGDFNTTENANAHPEIVNSASYRVIKYPAESPLHPGGAPALVTDPWTLTPGNATTLKWHSNGTTDYNITRGNNVWAKEDHAANNGNTGAPATSTTPSDPLSFDFVPNFLKQPNQTTPVPNQQFNITNLFYWINTYHDIMYQYGFDEPAGNYQANNQGRGGAGNDYVYGDAQDGNYVAPNQDNANFSSPADGGNGRMQMYLWDTTSRCIVNTPAAIAGTYPSVESAFSTANKLINIGPVTGQLVYYNDDAGGTTHEACSPPANSLTGKIVLIDRGTCTFVVKVKNAQNAGAIGVIMVNNVATPLLIIMAGADNTIHIPAICVSQATGAIFAAQIANNENITLGAANLDGDVDNGVIMHEHTHGLSNRLTGGPSQAGCLSNAENMGEGWSDYYSLMLTQNWATSTLADGENIPRGIGTYVIGQQPTGSGIRTQLYCTDFLINNLVYAASIDPESHNRGELWCATLWDMTWAIINQVGTINPNLHDATSGGGNTIALKLVTEGLKLQPCSPGFIDGRNAILKADTLLYGGAHSCVIKEAFRRRGMGPNASQGSSNSVTDQVADFATFTCESCAAVTTTTQPANITACTGTTATFNVVVSGSTPAYQWQVSTNGGTTYTNIAGQTSATLSIPNVTATMNGYLYQVVISNTCPSTVTSNPAALTVNNPAGITSQPTNLAVCSGANASFTATTSGTTNTYQWQVSTDGGTTFSDIPGATTTTLNLNAVTATMNGNQYHLIITSCGPNALVSTNVTLTVNSAAAITLQPSNTSACTGGGNATFTTTATGNSLTYQWQVSTNGGTTFTNIPGQTSATLTLSGVTSTMNNNVYHVVISNPCTTSLTSSPAVLTVSDPASISLQPVNSTVCAGANTSFSINTTGSSVTYQWQVSTDGGATFTDVPGATTATLNLPAVTGSMNNNQYHVLVFSCSPTGLSSSNVTLVVNSPVSITTQPVNTSACAGNNATITVAAAGTANSYQWQVSTDGGTTYTNIAGATSATLTINAVTASMNNNMYQVVVNNSCTPSAVVSAGVVLTVSTAAAITTQPINITACAGSNAVFTAAASGASYQWQVSTDGGTTFTDIPSATTTTLTLPTVTAAMNNNQYQLVIASCAASSISSNHVTLTVNNAAIVSSSPANTTVCTGADATFTATVTGTAPISYQWSVSTDGGVNYSPITGANSSTLTIIGVTSGMNGQLYQLNATNVCSTGSLTTAAMLTVSPATTISTQTTGYTTCEGSSATFNVPADNASGASYQWQVSSDGGTTFTNIAGATAAQLTLSTVTASMNNNLYHVVITGCGSVTSDNGMLTVNSAPVVTITASPYLNITSDITTTLTATSVPASTTFSWFKDGSLIAGVTGSTLVVAHSDLGVYNASVTDLNGCSNTSNLLTIADSVANFAFISPNPNNGLFYVRFPGIPYNSQPRYIKMYDSKGSLVYSKAHYVSVSGQKMEVHAEALSKGTYMLILTDAAGITLGSGKVVIN